MGPWPSTTFGAVVHVSVEVQLMDAAPPSHCSPCGSWIFDSFPFSVYGNSTTFYLLFSLLLPGDISCAGISIISIPGGFSHSEQSGITTVISVMQLLIKNVVCMHYVRNFDI